ncbi:MAG: hypothetical protein ACI35W_05140 [Anaeroplasmataceae bacterium]
MKIIKNYAVEIFASLLVILSLVLLFGDCIQEELQTLDMVEKQEVFTGYQAIFGYTHKMSVSSTYYREIELLKFSFLNLLPLIFTIIGIVLAFIKIPFGNYISGALLVIGGVFYFLMGVFTNPMYEVENVTYELLPCVIISGILTLLAGAVIIAKPYIKKILE